MKSSVMGLPRPGMGPKPKLFLDVETIGEETAPVIDDVEQFSPNESGLMKPTADVRLLPVARLVSSSTASSTFLTAAAAAAAMASSQRLALVDHADDEGELHHDSFKNERSATIKLRGRSMSLQPSRSKISNSGGKKAGCSMTPSAAKYQLPPDTMKQPMKMMMPTSISCDGGVRGSRYGVGQLAYRQGGLYDADDEEVVADRHPEEDEVHEPSSFAFARQWTVVDNQPNQDLRIRGSGSGLRKKEQTTGTPEFSAAGQAKTITTLQSRDAANRGHPRLNRSSSEAAELTSGMRPSATFNGREATKYARGRDPNVAVVTAKPVIAAGIHAGRQSSTVVPQSTSSSGRATPAATTKKSSSTNEARASNPNPLRLARTGSMPIAKQPSMPVAIPSNASGTNSGSANHFSSRSTRPAPSTARGMRRRQNLSLELMSFNEDDDMSDVDVTAAPVAGSSKSSKALVGIDQLTSVMSPMSDSDLSFTRRPSGSRRHRTELESSGFESDGSSRGRGSRGGFPAPPLADKARRNGGAGAKSQIARSTSLSVTTAADVVMTWRLPSSQSECSGTSSGSPPTRGDPLKGAAGKGIRAAQNMKGRTENTSPPSILRRTSSSFVVGGSLSPPNTGKKVTFCDSVNTSTFCAT